MKKIDEFFVNVICKSRFDLGGSQN